jgi:ribosomal protein S18 acetylase RimI-like enzyme
MAGVLTARPPLSITTPRVRTLTPADVPALRLPGARSNEAMRTALNRNSDRSVWIPDTLEYALIGSWRNRQEIVAVDELVAVRNVEPLLQAAFERAVACGDELLIIVELEAGGGRSRYARAGMELLEEVITYEIDTARVTARPQRPARLLPVTAIDTRAIERLARLDQRAFPWLWRNSREEFDVYLTTPGVDVSFVTVDGVPVAYIGTTLFTGWGHLDRIAVAPELQGQGFGQTALCLAIDSLRRQGARRIGLSTQRSNSISQRLYDRFGFQRTPELDYQLFGFVNPANRTLQNPR